MGVIYFSEPWTDFEVAKRAVGNTKIIRIDLNPPTSIAAPDDLVRSRLGSIARGGAETVLQVHMASARTGSVEEVVHFVEIGREIFGARRGECAKA
jgi:hypothetical protein